MRRVLDFVQNGLFHSLASRVIGFVFAATLMTSRHFPYLGEPRGPTSERLSILEANLTLPEMLAADGFWTIGVFTNPQGRIDDPVDFTAPTYID